MTEESLTAAERFAWWDKGVRDGIEALMLSAQVALRTLLDTLDDGDVGRTRMLGVVFEGLFDPHRLPRRDDRRVGVIELFVEDDQIDAIRKRAEQPDCHDPRT